MLSHMSESDNQVRGGAILHRYEHAMLKKKSTYRCSLSVT
jgi:hypothetical protein